MKASNTIFLAHASEDKPFVRKLYKTLKQNGLNPWFDEEDLPPGVDWNRYIKKVIREAKFFVICISRQSIQKTGYVQKEIRTALGYFEQKPPDTFYLIPTLIDNIELPDVSVGTINLIDYQAVRLFQPGGTTKLVQFLQKQMNLIQEVKKNEKPMFDEIRGEVAAGRLDKVLRLLESYVKNNSTDYLNNVILISARYNQLTSNHLLGTMSTEVYTMESNRVIFSVLELLKILEKEAVV
ncbi:MAG: TIR domain-containing protein [Aureispira sp.]